MSKRSLTRGEKRLFILIFPLVGLFAGAVSFNHQLNRDPVVVIPTPIPTPQPNGFDIYVQAAQSMTMPNPPVDPINDRAPNLTAKQKAQRYSLTRRKAWLKSNQTGLQLFQRALATPTRLPSERDLKVRGPQFHQLSNLVKHKVAEANSYKLQGRWDLAATTGLDLVQMGDALSAGATYITWIYARSFKAYGLAVFEDVPAHLNNQQAKAAIHRLEKYYPAPSAMAVIMEEDKWLQVSSNMTMLKNPEWRDHPLWGEFTLKQRARRRFLSKQTVIEDGLRLSDYCIQIVSDSPGQSIPPPPPDLNEWADALSSIYKNLALTRDTQYARTGLILYRLALRAYRVEHGEYPDSLRALVPGYLTLHYMDPFSKENRPYGYRKEGDSYKLWSIGNDRVDNNGVSIRRKLRPNQILIIYPHSQDGDNVVGP